MFLGQLSGPPVAKPQRDETKHAKRAVNQPPVNRYAAECAADERIRNDEDAGDHARSEQPNVPHRIAQQPGQYPDSPSKCLGSGRFHLPVFRLSTQCVTKNFFSVGSNVSAFPTIGRSAAVICAMTSRKIAVQTFKPSPERLC